MIPDNHNLTVDGLLNDETLSKIQARRYGNQDFDDKYNAITKYNRILLTWFYQLANHDELAIAFQALHIWEKHLNLMFTCKP